MQKKLHLAMEESKNNYLLSITYEIYHSMNEGYEIRGVFLDISKAFEKAWHEGLFLKIKAEWDIRQYTKYFRRFLRNRKQRVVFNGQTSNWENIYAGVP